MRIMKSAKQEQIIKKSQSLLDAPKKLLEDPVERTVIFLSQNTESGMVTLVFPSAKDAEAKYATFSDWRHAFTFLMNELQDFMRTKEKVEKEQMR